MRAPLLLALLALPAFAQSSAPSAAPPPAPPAVKLGEKGFVLESADGDFRLRFSGLIQADGRFFVGGGEGAVANTLLLRRVRPIVDGTVFGLYDFRFMPDFGGGRAQIQDAYVDAHPSKALRVRAGRYKAPFGLEFLQSDAFLPFSERALPTNLVPGRDVGLQLHGEAQAGVLSYAVGVFNGAPDGGNLEGDDEDGKDAVARVFAHPLRPLGVPALQNLGVGLAASYGRTGGAANLPQYRTAGQQVFFRYRAAAAGGVPGAVAQGERVRLSPQAYWYVGPLGLLSEYVRSSQEVAVGDGAAVRLTHSAWNATGSLVVYGGSAGYEGVKVRAPFRPSLGEWGALEVALRYSALDVDADAFPLFADPAASARAARAAALALNGYLNAFTRVSLHLERTTFDGGAAAGADRPAEQLVLGRLQLNF
ncbi:porin [Aggregicoccus sp. 17bor-14]|uniref:OprO/OprP family phosphate-selective porin n=1 Tax=Myxococcaceae TaxID=31 RepID=UPI00129CE8FC|nr:MULTISPECIES: porin [Myxococcaceae]MBF5045816.1 porin [Simulacricoccus sp. 17bor-14]MRI91551.1 porin [Aggregicoccus sp. 17bor-14]